MRVVHLAMAWSLLLTAGLTVNAVAAAGKAHKPTPEEQQKKADDVKNWPARDYMNATALGGPVCVYIKDPGPKSNPAAGFLEGKDILGNEEVRVRLRGFNRVKIKNDGSKGKGWPPGWTVTAEGGAILVLFSGDLAKVYVFERSRSKGKDKDKKELTKDVVLKAADEILKYDAERKAAADAKAREEAAKVQAEKKPELPGLDIKKAAPEKKKPSDKEPQDE